jgi:pimeloyl-ACP methyl ester carboxylesterase
MKRMQIDGRSLAYELSGRGDITVILETGIGAESAEWSPVAAALADHERVLRYDRAGRGSSTPAAGVRTVPHMLNDLHALLETTGARAPFLIVGHSFGGILARAFAKARPRETCGLILAESMHPRQFDVLGPLFPAPTEADAKPLAEMRTFWQTGWRQADSTAERIDFVRALAADDIEPGSLANVPLRVLSAASFDSALFIGEDARHRLQTRWNALQHEFISISKNSKEVFLEQSGHFIQRDQPDAIAHAILTMLDQGS